MTQEQEKNTGVVISIAKYRDCVEAEKWPDVANNKDGFGNMKWTKLYELQERKSSRFLCKIHNAQDNRLLALFAGRISANDSDGARVSIDFIERHRDATEIKGHVIVIALKYAYTLCDLFMFDFVKLLNPAPGLLSTYKAEMPDWIYTEHRKYSYLMAPVQHT
ncbi:hypothetical protein [Moritella viscosa]|uniref:Uncharacterized protein n=1 Tax=Moritella viscosa TaxID=80854 RepID=A0A1L0CJD0_9GAMM|nr:hypothetical protein [Moritella viscosa]SGZ17305.1 Putative uncharacterized protein [Moritella viscosa]